MDAITCGTPLKSVWIDDEKVRLLLEAFDLSTRDLARRKGCDHRLDLVRMNPLSLFAFMWELPTTQALQAAGPATPHQLQAVPPCIALPRPPAPPEPSLSQVFREPYSSLHP